MHHCAIEKDYHFILFDFYFLSRSVFVVVVVSINKSERSCGLKKKKTFRLQLGFSFPRTLNKTGVSYIGAQIEIRAAL